MKNVSIKKMGRFALNQVWVAFYVIALHETFYVEKIIVHGCK